MKQPVAVLLSFLALSAPESWARTPMEQDAVSSCGLYLAVSSSSTTDAPKWGLFAGETIHESSPIGYGEVAIHTFNLMANAMTEDEDAPAPLVDVADFIQQFIWVPHSSGGQFELAGPGTIVTAVPGVGVLGGYNPKSTNADWDHARAYLRPAWGEEAGVAHPGRGASSTYFETTLAATEEIPAGMEIFINYGDNWDNDIDKEAQITREDYPKIDEIIEKVLAFFDKHETELDPQSKQEIYEFLIKDVMYAAVGSSKGKAISDLFPESPDKLKQVQEDGGFNVLLPRAMRDISWLSEHGMCMDNIRPGPSTIPHAGRGAFATRPMKAGTAVAPVPLIHIPDSEVMNMHPLMTVKDEDGKDYFVRETDAKPNGSQLLLNYCLGHPESKLLFFPSGAGVSFINHSPESNAKLVWSEHPKNHLHWFDLKPELLHAEGNQHLGLLMEVIATKDIAEGEEVTIDYGREWEAAWKEYVANWEANAGATWPLRALDYNNMFKDKPIPLNADQYPENLMLKCFLVVQKPTDEPPVNDDGDRVRHWAESETVMRSQNLFNCTLMDMEEVTTLEGATSWNYTINWKGKTDTTIVKHVPQKAIVFVDKPGTSDQHMEHAFRHYIGIPDEIFPKGPWRNINEEYEEYEDDSDDSESGDDDSDDLDSNND